MQIEIKSRYSGAVLYAGEFADVRAAVEAAVKVYANLSDADLRGANLRGAYLSGADLRGAYLNSPDLRGADLRGADLRGANLRGANLRDANLRDADLRDANLRGANLRDANLRGANLSDANLRDADLSGAKLHDATLLDGNVVLVMGPIGSRSAYMTVFATDKGLRIQTGCFYGDADTFLARVTETHGTNQHAANYRKALEFAASMLPQPTLAGREGG